MSVMPDPANSVRRRGAAGVGGRPATRRAGAWCAALLAAALTACSPAPRAPDWQIEARDALARMSEAWLAGQDRSAAAEFVHARSALARTGDASLVARAELTRCALQTASLVFGACAGFVPLAADASAAERAYDAYLQGRASAGDAALLPEAHRAVAVLPEGAAAGPAVATMPDPLARLVAAGVLLRRGLADPATLTLAVDTASAQGWRRPLLAWLGVQMRRAEAAGAVDEAARLKRRMDLVSGRSAP